MVTFVVDPQVVVAGARPDDLQKEWQECRAVIGRLDGTLLDLRKYGFGLASTLLTATGVLGGIANLLPKSASSGLAFTVPSATIAALVAVDMALIVALFVADRYYSVLQWGAGNRARYLERDLGLGVTREILVWAQHLKTWRRVALIQYFSFILVAAALGTVVMGRDAVPSYPDHLAADLMDLAALVSLGLIWLLHKKAGSEWLNLSKEIPAVVSGLIATVRLRHPQSVAAGAQLEQETERNDQLPAMCNVLAVTKPIEQPGLSITRCRISRPNILAITFMNSSTTPMTPTDEDYQVFVYPSAAIPLWRKWTSWIRRLAT